MQSIAIITDIHGNAAALEAVLRDISRRRIREIYCLGDVVAIGPDTDRVFELLLAQGNITFISGNHNIALQRAFRREEPPPGNHMERGHHEWLAQRIAPHYVELMSRWPMTASAVLEGVPVLFTHYHLDQAGWYKPVDWNPTAEGLWRLYTETDYRLVIFGDHHVVHHFCAGRITFFNPGALGCAHSADAIARYGIVTLQNGDVTAEAVEVAYDNREFLHSYEELGVPDKETILRIFHGRDSH
ncbi:phosphodiesterase [compost metagenome]